MATFLLKVYPAFSHLNATLPLARGLVDRGHNVVYAGVADHRESVEAQGYRFVTHAPDATLGSRGAGRVPKSGFFAKLGVAYRRARQSRNNSNPPSQPVWAALINAVQPDAILVDAHYVQSALSLFSTAIPFAILSTKVALDRFEGLPPVDSRMVPNGRYLRTALIRYSWRWHFIRRHFWHLFAFGSMPSRRQLRDAASANALPLDWFETDRSHLLGLKTVPELMLSPYALDFPHQPKAHQRYIGSLSFQRTECGVDYLYEQAIAPMLEARRSGVPIVYCSFGTLSWQYSGVDDFLNELLAAAEGAPWNLVLAIADQEKHAVRRVPANVLLFRKVPQLHTLAHADLMITHGGMNSIKECVAARVPLIVYPGSAEFDQEGNAARVLFHRIGLRGRLRGATAADIGKKIRAVLSARQTFMAAIDRVRFIDGQHSRRCDGAATVEKLLLKTSQYAA